MNTILKHLFSLSICLLFLTPTLFAQRNLNIVANESWIEYQLDHPLHVTKGKTQQFQGSLRYNDADQKYVAVAISAGMQSFNSNNSSRDSHMLEVVEAIKFPRVTFTSNNMTKNGDQVTVNGTITFHGVTKPVQFQARTWKENGKLYVQGAFNVSLAAHNVPSPSFMSVSCSDALKMNFRGVFRM